MNKKKRVIAVISVICMLAALLTACGKKQEPVVVQDLPIIHETEFGGVYPEITIEDFNALGFKYGDSVDVEFSNGFKFTDIPYYNGYYTKNGEPLICAYPGYPYIRIGINNGGDLWEKAGLDDSMTVTITLNTAEKYLQMQETMNLSYSDIREEYPSDEVFANFREVTAGDILPGTLYRSASPCDNQHNRAPYVDELAEQAQIGFILDLADNDEKIQKYFAKDDFHSYYMKSLYDTGKDFPAAVTAAYETAPFRASLAAALTALAHSDGPYLVHCTEGKDRTGFVCVLLEALCGATFEEIRTDYMITYDNYYELNREKDPTKYDFVVENLLSPMMVAIEEERYDLPTMFKLFSGVADGTVPEEVDLAQHAANYLTSAGMTEEDVKRLKEKLTGK